MNETIEYSGPYLLNYDPRKIIRDVLKNYDNGEGNLELAQILYHSALLDWVDDFREMKESTNCNTLGLIKQAIVTLWISYANFNYSIKEFKVTTETFEAAVNCEVAGSVGRIWTEYSRYLQERGRHKSAQSVFLRALVGDENAPAGVFEEIEKSFLWKEFLCMMQFLKNDQSLNLDKLKVAVDIEHVSQIQSKNQNNITKSSNIYVHSVEDLNFKEMNGNNNLFNKRPLSIDFCEGVNASKRISTCRISIANKIEDVSIKLMKNTAAMSSELMAEWLVRDGNAPPTIPEPPFFLASPPKLGDSSGKDLLGTSVSLKLIRLLCKKSKTDISSSILLDICRGCWMLTALKEKEVSQALDIMDRKMVMDLNKLDSELDARLSVAGLAHSAVEQMNENERDDFIANCNQQRSQKYFFLAWELRQLLAIQQQILTTAGVPEFDGPTVDKTNISIQSNICSFLHSAFFLRSRIGEERHLKMLRSLESKLSSIKNKPIPP